MTGLSLLGPEDIATIWPDVRDYINDGLDAGERLYPERHYFDCCQSGEMQLWVSFDAETCEAAALTQINTFPLLTRCRVICCGGKNLDNWVNYMADIEQWAQSRGCGSISIAGRKGWARIFRDWPNKGILLSKDLAI